MYHKYLVASAVFLFGLLSGCASIMSTSHHAVNFTSEPNDAHIKIMNSSGKLIYSGTTPTIVDLKGKAGYLKSEQYQIVFSKSGYAEQVIPLKAELSNWYFGNILFGGLIGMLIVDPATGAMWKLPPNLSTTLKNQTTLSLGDGQKLNLAFLEQVPEPYRQELIRLQ